LSSKGAHEAAPAGAAVTCEEQERLLDRVSRTFALTIPELPPPLRLTVGNAYLLCRIIDTIEDEPTLTPEHKRRLSERFVAVVAGRADPAGFAERLGGCLSDRTSHWERVLVEATPRVVALTRSFAPVPRAAIERCVRIMASGMSEFQERRPTRGLADLAEMERYCYVVAGVVGEMLTDLFCDHCPEIAPRAPELRRARGALRTGAADDQHPQGHLGRFSPERLLAAPLRLRPARGRPRHPFGRRRPAGDGRRRAGARRHSPFAAGGRAGFRPADPPRERGIRIFCLWAIGMALLTLRRIRSRPEFRNAREVKISRHSVRATALACRLAAGSDGLLRLLFQAAGPAGGRAAVP
jgi:farnesyl-diphosphate farnesyltransferase